MPISTEGRRSVKPSAQPTLVRTQHLPPPAKTAPGLRKRGPAGRFLLVTPCISVCHRGSMRSSGYGHIADSVRAERAVRITARFSRSGGRTAWSTPADMSSRLSGTRLGRPNPRSASGPSPRTVTPSPTSTPGVRRQDEGPGRRPLPEPTASLAGIPAPDAAAGTPAAAYRTACGVPKLGHRC